MSKTLHEKHLKAKDLLHDLAKDANHDFHDQLLGARKARERDVAHDDLILDRDNHDYLISFFEKAVRDIDKEHLGIVYEFLKGFTEKCSNLKQEQDSKAAELLEKKMKHLSRHVREDLFKTLNCKESHHTEVAEHALVRRIYENEKRSHGHQGELTDAVKESINIKRFSFESRINSIINEHHSEMVSGLKSADELSQEIVSWSELPISEKLKKENLLKFIGQRNKTVYDLVYIYKSISHHDKGLEENETDLVQKIKKAVVRQFSDGIERFLHDDSEAFFHCWQDAPKEFKNSKLAAKIIEETKKLNKEEDKDKYFYIISKNINPTNFTGEESSLLEDLKREAERRIADTSSDVAFILRTYNDIEGKNKVALRNEFVNALILSEKISFKKWLEIWASARTDTSLFALAASVIAGKGTHRERKIIWQFADVKGFDLEKIYALDKRMAA